MTSGTEQSDTGTSGEGLPRGERSKVEDLPSAGTSGAGRYRWLVIGAYVLLAPWLAFCALVMWPAFIRWAGGC